MYFLLMHPMATALVPPSAETSARWVGGWVGGKESLVYTHYKLTAKNFFIIFHSFMRVCYDIGPFLWGHSASLRGGEGSRFCQRMFADDDQAEAEYPQAAEDGGSQGGAQLGEECVGHHQQHLVAQGYQGRSVRPQGEQEEGVARQRQQQEQHLRHATCRTEE